MVKAKILHLTLIKVITVFFLISDAKATKPNQYINIIKLVRCGPSVHRLKDARIRVCQYTEGLWCLKYCMCYSFLSCHLTLGWSPSGGCRLSTYRTGPSSYDVKTQRSALTEENNRHTFSLAFLRTHRERRVSREKAGHAHYDPLWLSGARISRICLNRSTWQHFLSIRSMLKATQPDKKLQRPKWLSIVDG